MITYVVDMDYNKIMREVLITCQNTCCNLCKYRNVCKDYSLNPITVESFVKGINDVNLDRRL